MKNKDKVQKPQSTVINYQGNVTVKAEKAGQVVNITKVRNHASNAFFAALLYLITKNSSYFQNMPSCVGAYKKTDDTIEEITIYKQNVVASNMKVNLTPEGASLTYTFTIPYSNLKTGETVNMYRLFANTTDSSDKYLMTIDTDTTITTDGHTNIIVEWTMSFSNNEINQNTKNGGN